MEFPLIELMLVNAPVFCSCLYASISCVGICMLTRYGERGTSWTRFGVVKDDLSWLLHLCAFPSSMRFITAIFHYIM